MESGPQENYGGVCRPLDVGVLVQFAGLDVVDHHPSSFGPTYELATEKFRAIVGPNFRQAALLAQSLEDTYEAHTGD